MTAVTFTLGQILPINPIIANMNEQATPAQQAAFRAQHHLDRPVVFQYVLYLDALAHGDLGVSLHTLRPVSQDLKEAIPATLELGLVSILVALPIGLVVGTYAALHRGRLADQVVRVISLAGTSAPLFWLALLALYGFFLLIPAFPGGGRLPPGYPSPPSVTGLYLVDSLLAWQPDAFLEALHYLALPAIILSLPNVSVIARFSRGVILEVLPADYILAAKAKGLTGIYILLHHTIRAAIPSLLPVAGVAIANVLTGAVLVETIFSWPGIGRYAYQSAIHADLPSMMGVAMFVAIVYASANIAVDVLQSIFDPRISLR